MRPILLPKPCSSAKRIPVHVRGLQIRDQHAAGPVRLLGNTSLCARHDSTESGIVGDLHVQYCRFADPGAADESTGSRCRNEDHPKRRPVDRDPAAPPSASLNRVHMTGATRR